MSSSDIHDQRRSTVRLERPLSASVSGAAELLIRTRLGINVPLFERAARLRSVANQDVDSTPSNERKQQRLQLCVCSRSSCTELSVLTLRLLGEHMLLGNDERQALLGAVRPPASRALPLFIDTAALAGRPRC